MAPWTDIPGAQRARNIQNMSTLNAQKLLAAAGHYGGALDGKTGPQSLAAAFAVLSRAGVRHAGWTDQRIVYAAAQALLDVAGHEPGHIDGFWGHNSANAFDAWEDAREGRPALVLDRSPVRIPADPRAGQPWPTQARMEVFYGPAGGARCTAGTVRFPFAHKLAWDLNTNVATFRCHDLIAPAFQRVFDEAAKHYGETEYRRLRLDLFGGCFNNRKMRGGSAKSTHAYGAAVDLDPERNQLKWGRDKASFARAEYAPFWKIVEGAGLVSLGRLKNFDWMHFQGALL